MATTPVSAMLLAAGRGEQVAKTFQSVFTVQPSSNKHVSLLNQEHSADDPRQRYTYSTIHLYHAALAPLLEQLYAPQ